MKVRLLTEGEYGGGEVVKAPDRSFEREYVYEVSGLRPEKVTG